MTSLEPQGIPALDRVPAEILNQIFTHIAIDSPFRDECGVLTEGPHPLLPVVKVNRRFNAVASPLMVRKWRMGLSDQSANGAGFARHLLKQPHLRSQVKSLALDVGDFDPAEIGDDKPQATVWWNRWPRSFIPMAECKQLAESAEKACPTLAGIRYEHGKVSWPSEVGLRSPSAIFTLVLAWATELQELDLTLAMRANRGLDPWLLQLVKLATGVLSPRLTQGHDLPPPVMFTKLRSVTLTQLDDPEIEVTHAASFFRLPSLRVFKAYYMDAAGLTLDEADQSGTGTALQPPADQLFPNGTSNVEEIHLYQSCTMSENGIRVLTKACKRLRVLILQWGDTFFTVSSTALLEAIKLHYSFLEEFQADGTADTLVNCNEEVDTEVFGGWLLRCDKLERLTISLEFLYGNENFFINSSSYPLEKVLPMGLTSLSLDLINLRHGGQLQATRDNILGLLRQCGPKGRFSRLEKLQLTDCIVSGDKEQDFMVLARNAGVVLTMRKCVREH